MWIILRTDAAKEAYCADQVQQAGFKAWAPAEVRYVRKHPKSKALVKREFPVLPRRIFVLDPGGTASGNLLYIRHIVAVERDSSLAPLKIDSSAIDVFRSEIDRVNLEVMAMARMVATRKERSKWRSLHDGLLDVIRKASGGIDAVA
jgi:hypothetical protein